VGEVLSPHATASKIIIVCNYAQSLHAPCVPIGIH
jgi:hypothetical protein